MSQELDTVTANGAVAGAGVLPISTRDRERFIPAHYLIPAPEGAHYPEGAPVYLLAPLTVAERRAVSRAVIGATGTFVTTPEVRECLLAGARLLLEPEEAERIASELLQLEALERMDDVDEETRERMEELRAALLGAQNRLSRLHEPLRGLLATQMGQLEALSYFTIKACVRGWENLPTPYKRRGTFVTDEALEGVPDDDLEELSGKCFALREVTHAQELDSASP